MAKTRIEKAAPRLAIGERLLVADGGKLEESNGNDELVVSESLLIVLADVGVGDIPRLSGELAVADEMLAGGLDDNVLKLGKGFLNASALVSMEMDVGFVFALLESNEVLATNGVVLARPLSAVMFVGMFKLLYVDVAEELELGSADAIGNAREVASMVDVSEVLTEMLDAEALVALVETSLKAELPLKAIALEAADRTKEYDPELLKELAVYWLKLLTAVPTSRLDVDALLVELVAKFDDANAEDDIDRNVELESEDGCSLDKVDTLVLGAELAPIYVSVPAKLGDRTDDDRG